MVLNAVKNVKEDGVIDITHEFIPYVLKPPQTLSYMSLQKQISN